MEDLRVFFEEKRVKIFWDLKQMTPLVKVLLLLDVLGCNVVLQVNQIGKFL